MGTIKKNDTSPALLVTLLDGEGNPVNLSGSSVRFHMRKYGQSEIHIDEEAYVYPGIDGRTEYRWSTGDTSVAGAYEAEFEVTYSDGTVETFPSSGFLRIEIVDAIA